MATYYVWHGSAQDDSDATWNSSTLAKVTLGAAVTAAAALGDQILVHKSHLETLAADANYVVNTNHVVANPLQIIVVDKDASDAPVNDYTDMGANGIDGNSLYHIVFNGCVYIWGLRLISGDSASWLNKIILENCELGFNRSTTEFFGLSTKADVDLINCLLSFSGGGAHYINVQIVYTALRMYGGLITHTNPGANLVVFSNAKNGCSVTMDGVDLTGIDPTAAWAKFIGNYNSYISIRNCALPASPPQIADTGAQYSTRAEMINCGSTDGRYYSDRTYNNEEIIHDTSIYRTAGAKYDGSNGYSFNMLTAGVVDGILPFRRLLAVIDGGSLSGKDLEIHLTHDVADNSGVMQDDEIWVELHALDDTSGVHWETTRPKPTATPGDLAADSSEGWTGAKTYKQKISHAWAAGATSGLVYVYLCVAKAFAGGSGADVFICPKVDIV